MAHHGPPLRATKYTYDVSSGEWHHTRVQCRIAPNSFAEGGMRRCYFVQELAGDDGEYVASVGKVIKEEEGHGPVVERDYFDEAMTQMVAESYAQAFSRKLQPTSKLGEYS